MSLWADYRTSKRMYYTQKALEPFKDVSPTDMPNQLRIDICSAGISIATLEANAFMFVNSFPCENYGLAMGKALEEIRAMHFLKSGYALILTLWPAEAKHDTIPIGSNHKFASAKLVDQKIMSRPEELRIDLAYAYRAIYVNSLTAAHYIGLKTEGWDLIQQIIPTGVVLARYWGPLATFEALLQHFHSVFATEDMLLGLVDFHSVYYCKLAKGILSGFKISNRASMQNTDDLKKTLKDFDLDRNSKIYMVNLTASSADTDDLCMQASQQMTVDINMVEKGELLKSLQMLAATDRFPFLPITLIQGGKDAKFHP